MNRTEIISFRVKTREKEYLSFLAKAEDMKVSELIRNIIIKRIRREKMFNIK